MFFSQKYENIVSISSLFFFKSIKIFAKEKKKLKKKNRAAPKEQSSMTINTVFFTKTRTFYCYLTHLFSQSLS